MSTSLMRCAKCFAPAVLCLGAPLAPAQVAPVVELKAPTTPPDEFTRIVSLRELADGRLLISDRGENRIRLVSFDGAKAVPLGSVGAGPGEYRAAGALIALPGDSTALIDSRNGRWLIFVGGKITGTIERDGKIESIPVGVSAKHEFMLTYPLHGLGGAPRDSVGLMRTDRRTRKADTVAFLAAQTARQSAPRKQGDYTIVPISISPWTAGDQALLFEDGWLAIARLQPYSVDWIPPGGKLQRGNPIRPSDPPFTDADKRAFMQSVAEVTGKPPQPIDSRSDWPDVITAFTSATSLLGAPAPALFAGPRGVLIVRRQASAAEPLPRYDVVDRTGRVAAQFVLARRETLIGAGIAHLYVAATDDDGIQRLRRYDWPLSR